MPRDLSKVLAPAEVDRLQRMLRQHPEIAPDENEGGEYPKMLYSEKFGAVQAIFKDHLDPLEKKKAVEQLRHLYVIVWNAEDEIEYLKDGYKASPADFLPESEDTRIPRGREARLAGTQKKQSMEDELRNLRRRYAQLTGQELEDTMPAPKVGKTGHAAKRSPLPTRRASASSHHASV